MSSYPPLDDGTTALLRVPFHSHKAESSLRGGLLLDNAAWDRVGDLLRPADFYRNENRMVLEAIESLFSNAKAVDVIVRAKMDKT